MLSLSYGTAVQCSWKKFAESDRILRCFVNFLCSHSRWHNAFSFQRDIVHFTVTFCSICVYERETVLILALGDIFSVLRFLTSRLWRPLPFRIAFIFELKKKRRNRTDPPLICMKSSIFYISGNNSDFCIRTIELLMMRNKSVFEIFIHEYFRMETILLMFYQSAEYPWPFFICKKCAYLTFSSIYDGAFEIASFQVFSQLFRVFI